MLVEEVMSRSVITLAPEQTLRDAVNLLRSKHIRQLPVVEDSRLIGIITDRDIKRATPSLLQGVDREVYDRVLDTTQISQFMTREPLTVTPDSDLKDAVMIFIDSKIGALPVVTSGKLVGIITQIDALRVLYGKL
jgi:acetoin utilization protein AcuB